MDICKPKLSAYLLYIYIYASRTAQSDVKECVGFVTQKTFTFLHSSFLYDHLILKSLGTHLAQTPLIWKCFVRMLNTEDLLTPHMDPTSLNLRLLWWCHEYGISRYPYLTNVFQISQRNIYTNSFWKSCIPLIHTWSWHCLIFLWSLHHFLVSVKAFHKLNAEITCVLTARCPMRIADVIFTDVF
jgi:hypothetical protein